MYSHQYDQHRAAKEQDGTDDMTIRTRRRLVRAYNALGPVLAAIAGGALAVAMVMWGGR